MIEMYYFPVKNSRSAAKTQLAKSLRRLLQLMRSIRRLLKRTKNEKRQFAKKVYFVKIVVFCIEMPKTIKLQTDA